VLKLERELARIEPDGQGLRCGGGARLPAVAARAAGLGLAGIEFAVNIPGTVGGAVRMNANAYDGALAAVLEWVEVTSAEGASKRRPDELGFGYRHSSLGDGEIVSRARFALEPGAPEAIRATIASMRERRHAAQPKGIRTFGSTFKNPPGHTAGQLLADAGVAELAVGGARFSRKHANFVENAAGATTSDILALMALGRERVRERFGIVLEPEVELLGDARFPW
jgi:UDP-N-acetylmuramate dehydrogenase